jgi:hypothetical protein
MSEAVSENRGRWITAGVIAVLAVGIGVWMLNREGTSVKPAPPTQKPISSGTTTTPGENESELYPKDYGRVQAVASDANPAAASIAEAVRTKTHPERLSAMIQPKKFDPAIMKDEKAYQAYLGIHEPGRCYQSAQPGQGVSLIRSVSKRFVMIRQGESAVLKVRAVPNAPVTFTSFDLGTFSNKLTSITVRADKTGLAKAEFFASGGTIADCNIRSSCPLATGSVQFTVNITGKTVAIS